GSAVAGQQELIFKHILTREVAYESLPRRDRVGAHAEVARWIEDTAGERRDEFVELLAHHYVEAHRGAREDGRIDAETVERLRRGAFDSLLRASVDARSKMALSKARRLAEQAEAVGASAEERAMALEALGLVNLTDYQGDMAYRAFRDAAGLRAAEIPEGRLALARVCARALASVPMIQGVYTGLEDQIVRRLELVAGDVDPQERGDTYAAAAWVAADVGRYRDAARLGVEGAERTITEMPGVAIHCLARASVA